MFVERRVNSGSGEIELWKCEWENRVGTTAKKRYISKIGVEAPLSHDDTRAIAVASAICWSYGRTLGNIAVFSPTVLGTFPGTSGEDATLPCDFVSAGKFRHGAARWWCRTHQSHWGTKADLLAYEKHGEMVCANHLQLMNYVISPQEINVNEFSEVGVWCSMPAALSTFDIKVRPPKIHVHVRKTPGMKKDFDGDVAALAVLYSDDVNLLASDHIERVNITPPAAFEFVIGLEADRPMDCINCSHCGYPHLDLGDFAKRAHRKHFCANCGRDSTWSKSPIISTPLKPLHDQYSKAAMFIEPDRRLNLNDFPDCSYTIWASTPAIIWTADRPQEKGIHVHVNKGSERIVDDTFSEVILGDERLSRATLIETMISRTIV